MPAGAAASNAIDASQISGSGAATQGRFKHGICYLLSGIEFAVS
jgi:hypothetical protein